MNQTMFIKLGILLAGFFYAGVLPYTIKRSVEYINFDLKKYTLSFLSNKELYGKNYQRGYKQLLFATAIFNYLFFWLLSLFYDLGENERFIRLIDYSFAFLTLLAFVPHNMYPYKWENLKTNLQRITHNLLAVIVFISLPTLIIIFQTAILKTHYLIGLIGLIIIGLTVLAVGYSIIKKGVNGITEMLFINGISIWSIFVTVITFIR